MLAASAAYVYWHLDRGWVPHDEGALADGAMRLLRGELPHRDFDDIYTGGLAYLNVGAFGIFGTTLFSMRLMLLVALCAWVPAVFYVASRLVRPISAAAVTLVAVVWSVPNYPAAMPSWYNLFLATFGVAALFRYLETNRSRWLVAAGVAGGLSILMKIVGLYYVAGVLLFLIFHSHATCAAHRPGARRPRGRGYAVFVTVGLLAFVAVLAGIVRRQAHPAEAVQFVLPGTLIACLLARNEWMQPAGGSRARLLALARLLVPFLAGVALPVVAFVAPYLSSGSLDALVHGVFVTPTKRFGFATLRALPLSTAQVLVVPAILVAAMERLRTPLRGSRAAVVVLAFALLLLAAGHDDRVYRGVWDALRNLLPLLAVAAVIVLSRPRRADADDPLLRARTMALLGVTALTYLVQFPFAAPIYFCYVAPLVALTAVALVRYVRTPDRVIMGASLVFVLAFGIWLVNGTLIQAMGIEVIRHPRMVPLPLARAGLEVPEQDAAEMGAVIGALRQRARGSYTWASPDCPEVYFLSGLRNPTRSLYDFFDDSTGRTERVLNALTGKGVTAIVVNRAPAFSPRIAPALLQALEQRYPFATNIGRFQLRWRT